MPTCTVTHSPDLLTGVTGEKVRAPPPALPDTPLRIDYCGALLVEGMHGGRRRHAHRETTYTEKDSIMTANATYT